MNYMVRVDINRYYTGIQTTSDNEGLKVQKRVNVSINQILTKKVRGRLKKSTVFKNSLACTEICTEVKIDSCTALEILPLSLNGKNVEL